MAKLKPHITYSSHDSLTSNVKRNILSWLELITLEGGKKGEYMLSVATGNAYSVGWECFMEEASDNTFTHDS